ncbi:chromatin associated protein KTI12, partial [Pisolithus sp. B1]
TFRLRPRQRHPESRLADPSYTGPSLSVVLLSDDTLNIDRSSYNDSRSEKPARGTLFTAVQRNLAQNTIIIVDSLNYIKGFRYRVYCVAREIRVRVCTVYVLATPDLCKQWNSERTDGEVYGPETRGRPFSHHYKPSSMVRWDSPLFAVSWTDEDVPADDIWRAITEGVVKPPNTPGNTSYFNGLLQVANAPTDALRTLEHTAASIVSALVSEQTNSGSLGGTTIITLSSTLKVRITPPPRNVTLSELQRLKRQFVTLHKKAITLGTTEKGVVDWNGRSVVEKFVVYFERVRQ